LEIFHSHPSKISSRHSLLPPLPHAQPSSLLFMAQRSSLPSCSHGASLPCGELLPPGTHAAELSFTARASSLLGCFQPNSAPLLQASSRLPAPRAPSHGVLLPPMAQEMPQRAPFPSPWLELEFPHGAASLSMAASPCSPSPHCAAGLRSTSHGNQPTSIAHGHSPAAATTPVHAATWVPSASRPCRARRIGAASSSHEIPSVSLALTRFAQRLRAAVETRGEKHPAALAIIIFLCSEKY
jgi:hypothetical protein